MRFLLLSCALLLLSGAAHASTITDLITFTASGDLAASGSFTLTFDPTQTYDQPSTGLTVNSLSNGLAGVPASFIYDAPGFPPGTLTIGGLPGGVGSDATGSTDYFLTIYNLLAVPQFGAFVSTSSDLRDTTYLDFDGNVAVSTETAISPEPCTLALLATGVVGMVGFLRRRNLSAT